VLAFAGADEHDPPRRPRVVRRGGQRLVRLGAKFARGERAMELAAGGLIETRTIVELVFRVIDGHEHDVRRDIFRGTRRADKPGNRT
jgi:hypothetical protein